MIIGIECVGPSGVAVYEDGQIIFAASEERYSNVKNDTSWPELAIDNIKKKYDITPNKIEKIILVSENQPGVQMLVDIAKYSIEDYLKEQNEYWRPILLEGKEADYSNASVYVMENNKLKQLQKYTNFNIGRIYRYITLLLGMKPNEHEYKVMGLAPYANKYIYSKPLEVFRKAYQFKDGKVIIDLELKDNYFYFKDRLEGMRFDGIAAAVQTFTEEMCKNLISFWCNKTSKGRCVVGGCSP